MELLIEVFISLMRMSQLHFRILDLLLGLEELGKLSLLLLLELLYLTLEGCVHHAELCLEVLVLPLELHGSKEEL